jgi:hypothetical protein
MLFGLARPRALWMSWLTLAALGLSGCAGLDQLDGSIKDKLSLAFDRIEALGQADALVINYRLGDREIVAKIVVTTDETDLTGKKLEGPEFLARVALSRSVVKNDQFPEILSGDLTFKQYSTRPGDTISGEFTITFKGGDGLTGRFDAKVLADPTEPAADPNATMN